MPDFDKVAKKFNMKRLPNNRGVRVYSVMVSAQSGIYLEVYPDKNPGLVTAWATGNNRLDSPLFPGGKLLSNPGQLELYLTDYFKP